MIPESFEVEHDTVGNQKIVAEKPELVKWAKEKMRELVQIARSDKEKDLNNKEIQDQTNEALPPESMIADDKFVMKFLRASKFDPEKACKLVLKYWYFRAIKLGLEDLSIEKVDSEIAKSSFYLLTEARDKYGRKTVLFQPQYIQPSEQSRDDYLRILFLVGEKAIEDELTQKMGLCCINDSSNAGISSFDLQLMKSTVQLMQGAFPIRVGRIIVVNQPTIFQVVYPLVRPLLNPKVSDRFEIIGSNYERLREFFDDDQILETYQGTVPVPKSTLSCF